MPKAKQIAEYVIDHNVNSEELYAALRRNESMILLPVILKYIKGIYEERHPTPVIESAFQLDDSTLSLIKGQNNIIDDKNSLSRQTSKFVINKKLLGGYTVIKDYKIRDESILGIMNKLFK